jgi:hypothetical protein
MLRGGTGFQSLRVGIHGERLSWGELAGLHGRWRCTLGKKLHCEPLPPPLHCFTARFRSIPSAQRR